MRWSGSRFGAAVWLCLVMLSLLMQSAAPAASAQSPSPVADLDADAALATVELMNLAPPGVLETCMPASTDGGLALDGVVAAAQCLADGGVVLYVRFDDEASLHAGYDVLVSFTGLAPDTGTACRDGAFEGEYLAADGTVRGRLVCQLGPDGPMAVWTDAEALALGIVQVMGGADFGVLETAWQGVRLGAETRDASVADEATPQPDLATAAPLAATPRPVVQPPTGRPLNQWASGATASSEYGSDSRSAAQATGPPNTTVYGDNATAWAPAAQDGGAEWIELTFDTAVVPTKILIWETSGNGFVTSVEAWHGDDGWVTLWQGVDDSPEVLYGFTIRPPATDVLTDRLRITIDSAVPGWNEIDSVELAGLAPDES